MPAADATAAVRDLHQLLESDLLAMLASALDPEPAPPATASHDELERLLFDDSELDFTSFVDAGTSLDESDLFQSSEGEFQSH